MRVGRPDESPILLSLGSNLGPAGRIFQGALEQLTAREELRLLQVSSLLCSDALGPGQPAYSNQVAVLACTLPPISLLALLQQVERAFGRRPHRRRWAPRTLDLDLLRYGSLRLCSRHLLLPHPGLERAYLAPLLAGLPPWFEPEPGRS